jgi:hypothetical protein
VPLSRTGNAQLPIGTLGWITFDAFRLYGRFSLSWGGRQPRRNARVRTHLLGASNIYHAHHGYERRGRSQISNADLLFRRRRCRPATGLSLLGLVIFVKSRRQGGPRQPIELPDWQLPFEPGDWLCLKVIVFLAARWLGLAKLSGSDSGVAVLGESQFETGTTVNHRPARQPRASTSSTLKPHSLASGSSDCGGCARDHGRGRTREPPGFLAVERRTNAPLWPATASTSLTRARRRGAATGAAFSSQHLGD